MLNPGLQSKITPFQKGISDYEGFIEVPATVSGSAVFSTDKDFIETLGSRGKGTVKVDIVSIDQVFNMVAREQPGKRIFLKLDCEGEEYKIMESLASQGRLSMVSCIALEWHFKGFESLCSLLTAHGFSVFNLGRTEISPPCGMIYAINMKTRAYA
jgi:FkbM family methyltransferase